MRWGTIRSLPRKTISPFLHRVSSEENVRNQKRNRSLVPFRFSFPITSWTAWIVRRRMVFTHLMQTRRKLQDLLGFLLTSEIVLYKSPTIMKKTFYKLKIRAQEKKKKNCQQYLFVKHAVCPTVIYRESFIKCI